MRKTKTKTREEMAFEVISAFACKVKRVVTTNSRAEFPPLAVCASDELVVSFLVEGNFLSEELNDLVDLVAKLNKAHQIKLKRQERAKLRKEGKL